VQITFAEGHPFFCPEVLVLSKMFSINVMMKLDGTGRSDRMGGNR
jgi:hypothetical protein